MALHQQAHPGHHAFPWWLELVGAGLIGAAVLFGALLIAGHTDLLPGQTTAPVAERVLLDAYRQGEIGIAPGSLPYGLYVQRQEEIGAIQR